MKKLFTLVFCFIALIASSQNTFESVISSPIHTEHVLSIIQLKGGSYVILGRGAFFDSGYYLVKLNSQGSIVAQKKINKGLYQFQSGIGAITATSDGGFAAAGTYSDNVGGYPFFAKYDSSLNEQTVLVYHSISFRLVSKIVQLPDDGFLIGGGAVEAHFFRINNDGSYVANSFQVLEPPQLGIGGTVFLDMVLTKDGKVLLLCENPTSRILKTTLPANDGSTSGWGEQYVPLSGSGNIDIQALYPTSDSGCVFTAQFNGKWILCKEDSLGNPVWTKLIDNAKFKNYTITSVVETKDNSYVFSLNASGSISAGTDTTISYLIKLGKDGIWQWNKTFQYRDSASSVFSNLLSTSDGGFVTAGNVGNVHIIDSSDIVVYKYDSAFNTCSPLGSDTTNLTTDFALALGGGANGFQPLNVTPLQIDTVTLPHTATAFSRTNPCSEILPVHLLSFNATLQNKAVNVAWKTTNEINTDHFVVERSGDARSFSDLQSVVAKGNGSTNAESYAANDLQPLQGTSYYRLKEVSKDGTVTYSNIESVTMLANGTLVINPNPVHDNLHVLLQSRVSGEATFMVSDITGKIVAKQKSAIIIGMNTLHIPAASLSKGMYVLKVIQNNTVQSVKFIKQ